MRTGQCGDVLEHTLRTGAVGQLDHQPPPRTDQRFDQRRVADGLQCGQRGLRGEAERGARCRQSGGLQRHRGAPLVTAHLGRVRTVDHHDSRRGEAAGRIRRTDLADLPVQHETPGQVTLPGQEPLPARVDVVEGNTTPVECVEQPFLVRADPAREYRHPAVTRVRWCR
jgi:hypothetical protein